METEVKVALIEAAREIAIKSLCGKQSPQESVDKITENTFNKAMKHADLLLAVYNKLAKGITNPEKDN
jgi:translation elongation factor EF-Ts